MINFFRNNLVKIGIFLFIVLVIFFSRQVLTFRYDPEYYENWYYHCQWNIPNSTRGIGDGDLYKFSGFVLANGGNPFDINYPVPPFGKWIYGLAEKYVGNPYFASIIFYLLSIWVMYRLSLDIFVDKTFALLSTLLFVSTPFVTSQLKETMLDLPLMFLFLTNIYFFNKFFTNNKIKPLILAGIFLGLATGTKIGIYSPLLLLFGIVVLMINKKSVNKISNLVTYIASTAAGYVLAYTSYFIHHPNPIPWLRLHQKSIGYYLTSSSNASFDHLAQWKGIFLNHYKPFWQPMASIHLGDWSPLLPLGVAATMIILVISIKKKQLNFIYMALFMMTFLLMNTFVPFFPRYLMPIIPLLVIFSIYLLRPKKYLIIILVLLNLPFLYYSMVYNPVENQERDMVRFTTTLAYRELYRIIIPGNISENEFIKTNEYFYQTLGVKNISVNRQNLVKDDGNDVKIKYQINYDTVYGPLTYFPEFEYKKINNQWKVVWKWNYLAPDFGADSQIIINESKKSDWWAVYVAAHYLTNWSVNIQNIADITGLPFKDVDDKVRQFVPDFYPRFVGYLDPKLGADAVKIAQSTAGVTLKSIGFKQNNLPVIPATGYLQSPDGQKTTILFPKN
jgi:hypothetical protein